MRLHLVELDVEDDVDRVLLAGDDAGGECGRHLGPVDRDGRGAHALDGRLIDRERHGADLLAGKVGRLVDRLVGGEIAAAEIVGVDHADIGRLDQALVELLHHRRVDVHHLHQMVDVAVEIGRVERREGLVERTDAAGGVVREGDGAERDRLGQLLQLAELRGRIDLHGDVAARMLAHRFREPVGLGTGDAGRLVVVAVAQGDGLGAGEARRHGEGTRAETERKGAAPREGKLSGHCILPRWFHGPDCPEAHEVF